MEFNSPEFLIFFIFIFAVLWKVKKQLKLYNILLLLASYTFYGLWDYRFLILIFISSCVDFIIGYYMPKSSRKGWLMFLSATINLGLLMFFKYYNFFVESANDLLNVFGVEDSYHTLSIILPVGISFYTFQTLSYSIDIYKGKIKPTKDFLVFLNFVSFFPQLVAGPIERASRFLPQFESERKFNYDHAVVGMRLLLYGIFKKVVIADNIGKIINPIFADPSSYSDLSIFVGGPLFLIQLYADFSAYTDIARGIAALLGFNLMENFKTPLFSKNIPELWSRWHISLTTWFRDYLFIWLAGLRKDSTSWRIIATIILFVIIGFWHGANYTFILFGLLNGIYFIPKLLARKSKKIRDFLSKTRDHKIIGFGLIIGTFLLQSYTTILFRSNDLTIASEYFSTVLSTSSLNSSTELNQILLLTFLFLSFEWFMKDKKHPFDISAFNPILRKFIYVGMIFSILVYGYYGEDPFYYFQF